jgi:hypothetical protein
MFVHFVSSGKSTTKGAKVAEDRGSRFEGRDIASKAILDLQPSIFYPHLLRLLVVGFHCFGASLVTT